MKLDSGFRRNDDVEGASQSRTRRDRGDFHFEARVGKTGNDEKGRGGPSALKQAVSHLPEKPDTLRIGDEDMTVDEVPCRHALSLQDREDVAPSELVLELFIKRNIAIEVDADLT